jgi:RimJ/RimL family protein N-acetyltransferase
MLTDRAFESEGESRMSPKTGQVSLRAPVPADAEARAALGISAAINRMYGFVSDTPDVMTSDHTECWLQGVLNHPNAWVIEEDGKLVGGVGLNSLDKVDRRARLAIGMFNERHIGRGIGRKAIDLVLQQAFGPLGLHRVDLRVLSFNIRAIRCYEACGFRLEGIERESALVDGEWHDDWIMAILEQDFRARTAARQAGRD